MPNHLFRPRRVDLPPRLLLVPRWLDRAVGARVQHEAIRSQGLFGATLHTFPRHAVLSGFFGYPHLLTLLEVIAGVQDKEIVLLGSAGAIDPRLAVPRAVEVSFCAGYGPLARFHQVPLRPLTAASGMDGEPITAVTVDLLQRETPTFLRHAARKGWQVVEMELFPLLAYLTRPPAATLVLTDRLTRLGIVPHGDRREIGRLFADRFDAIMRRWYDSIDGNTGSSVCR